MFISIDKRAHQLVYILPEIRENAQTVVLGSLREFPLTVQQRYDESKRVPTGKQPLNRRSTPVGATYPTDKPSSKRKPDKRGLRN